MALVYRNADRTLFVDGQSTPLTEREGDLLRYLLDRAGQVISRTEIEREVWGFRAGVRSEVVPVTVRRLRKKLGTDRLETIRGTGWRLNTPSEAPQVPPGDPPAHIGLPATYDRFVGRQIELATLDLLFTEGARLVTLVGPGGAGKTRLSIEYGSGVDRVVFCDLTQARDASTAAALVANVLGRSLGEGAPEVAVKHILTNEPPALYVLDNFEQLTPASHALLQPWLEAAPEARFLATSRERLGLPAERVLPVPPLDADTAFDLFESRAGAIDPATDLKKGSAATAELIRMLDGLPLAIELAAARTALLTPEQLLGRLSDRFRLLVDRKRDKRQTLEECMAWSWELLEPHEADVLDQLSVFEGAFTLEDAEGVVDAGSVWVLDVLQSLVEKSLVRRASPERFQLLLSIRELGARHLRERGAEMEVALRHAVWFARFGNLESTIQLAMEGEWSHVKPLDDARTELAAAARLEGLPAPTLACLARANWLLARHTGPFGPSLQLLRRAMAVQHSPVDQATLGGFFLEGCRLVGAWKEGATSAPSILEATRRVQASLVQAAVLNQWARLLLLERRLDEAAGLFEEAMGLYEASTHTTTRFGAALVQLAKIHRMRAQPHRARARLQEAMDTLGQSGNARVRVDAHLEACVQAAWEGDWKLSAHHRSLAQTLLEGDHLVEMQTRLLALDWRVAGNIPHIEARSRLIEARDSLRILGSRWAGSASSRLAVLELRAGTAAEARAHFEDAVASFRARAGAELSNALASLAYYEAEFGDSDRALVLAEESLALRSAEASPFERSISLGTVAAVKRIRGDLAGTREALDEACTLLGVGAPQTVTEGVMLEVVKLALVEGRVQEAAEAADRVSMREQEYRLAHARVAEALEGPAAARAVLETLDPQSPIFHGSHTARELDALRRRLDADGVD